MGVTSAAHPFAVCFVPAVGASLRLRLPLRIGEPLDAHDDALDLAAVAAAELPAYGFPRGDVIVLRNADVVQSLRTPQRPAGPRAPSLHQSAVSPCGSGAQRTVARVALEDLRQQVSRARPAQAAPPAWIACLDQAQRVLASADDHSWQELGERRSFTVDTLHQRVVALLHQFG